MKLSAKGIEEPAKLGFTSQTGLPCKVFSNIYLVDHFNYIEVILAKGEHCVVWSAKYLLATGIFVDETDYLCGTQATEVGIPRAKELVHKTVAFDYPWKVIDGFV